MAIFRHRRVAAVIDTEPEFYQEAGPEPSVFGLNKL